MARKQNHNIPRSGVILGFFTLVTVAWLLWLAAATHKQIDLNRHHALKKTIDALIDPQQYDNDILQSCVDLAALEIANNTLVDAKYVATKAGQAVAAIINIRATDGYSGHIHLSLAIFKDASLAGVRAGEHRETPGLGDKIEADKDDWILNFVGKNLTLPSPDQWHVKKDGGAFDQLSGATITARAVIHSVANTLHYFATHKQQVLQMPYAYGEHTSCDPF